MKQVALPILAAALLAGCAADILVSKRNSNETGRGTFTPMGMKGSITIAGKVCSGNYARVRDSSSVGLISTYGQNVQTSNVAITGPGGTAVGSADTVGTSSGSGVVTSASTTGTAKGMLFCNDGDVWQCEARHDGPSGFGICVGKDGAVYDVLTGFFGN